MEIFYTGAKGFGLRARTPIKKGSFIIEYVGEVVNQQELNKRTKK